MESPSLRKRKYVSKVRRVTACSECHRRKQKCDRQKPCAVCVSRGHPDRCVYGAAVSPQQLQSPISITSTITDRTPSVINELCTTAISQGIGYVDTTETGVLQSLNLPNPRHGRTSSSRGLPSGADEKVSSILAYIPEPYLARTLIDVFFTQANWYFSVLDRCFFDQRYRTFLAWFHSSPREPAGYEICYAAALTLQIIAMALHFLPEANRINSAVFSFTQPTPDDKSRICSEAAESLLNFLGRRQPDLSSVEADIMRCAWLKNSGHGIDAWHSLSNAVRQAQDLRLHLEPLSSVKEDFPPQYLYDVWHCEHKRRIWACLLTWEAHMALQLGRPRMINISDCTVRKPTNCDAPKDTTRTFLREYVSRLEIPSHYTSHIVKYEIALMIHRAMNNGLLRSDSGHMDSVQAMYLEVQQLLSHLPPAFKQPEPDTSWDIIDPSIPKLRLQIQIVVNAFLLALYRPHIFTNSNALLTAVQAAKNVLDLSQQLFELVEENQHKTFTLAFYTIDAGIFLAVALARFSSSSHHDTVHDIPKERFVETLERSIVRLEFLEKFHTVATAGKEVLRNCLTRLHTVRQELEQLEASVTELLPSPSSPTMTEAVEDGSLNTAPPLSDEADEENDQFWANWLNDSAFTATWLDGQSDPSLNFDFFNESAATW